MWITNLRRIGVLAVLVSLMMLGLVVLAVSYSEIGITDAISRGKLDFGGEQYAEVPQAVSEEASSLAYELYSGNRERYEEFLDELLTTYLETENKDFLILFNPGGWGSNSLEASPGWVSIVEGVQAELEGLDYSSVLLSYQRTQETIRGQVKEFVEAMNRYPVKARDLAYQVRFITDTLPEVRVIIAGESNGTVISDSAMTMLQDNPRVFSIQTGTPFWHRPAELERTLVLNSNGSIPDTFSAGNIPAIAWASIRSHLGLLPDEEEPGHVMKFLRAPGHDYSWRYPYVCSQIIAFLQQNLGIYPMPEGG